jgi:hypothetical protein
LGVEVRDSRLCIIDLYDLMRWDPECPLAQCIDLDDGFYNVTLLSRMPASGVLGDDQEVLVFLQKVSEMPELTITGIPYLC